MSTVSAAPGGTPTAIVGMAGRFPGAPDVDALWSMLSSGTEAVRRFPEDELRAAGVPDGLIHDPDYVPWGADLPGIEDFDAAFFGITPGEARLIDPQHRIFLECVWAGLEDAGTPPTAYDGRIGVFGSTSLSSYLLHHVLRSADHRDQAFTYPVLLGNDKDFLATRTSYALDLRGPSVTVQSACSSSLVAVDEACAALRSGRCDVAVAGGVSVFTPQTVGHRYQTGGTFTRDGHCRPFDAAATGMVRGSGCGVVVLKRLDDALADRDVVHAVVAGSAVNNDGSAKAGYSAPGAVGQDEVVRACLDTSGVPASSVGYVEAHGTGTYLGDPIEVAALQLAYERSGDPPRECALGSIKANIGHLDAAAGIAGLIKTALVLRHQVVPPQINFTEPNPELQLPDTPFVVHTRPTRPASPLTAAAVTSLGIGGTNAHCVLTAPPTPPARAEVGPDPDRRLLLSAPDRERLRDTANDLVAHLRRHPGTRLDDLAHTLARGRLPLAHRAVVTAATMEEALSGLREVGEGHFTEPGDADAYAAGRIGDVRDARKTRLPGLRLRRTRHWIEPEPEDRRTRQEGAADADTAAVADPVEAVAGAFRSHLGVESVGPDDDYFSLGGDSLHAISLVDALREQLHTELTLERFTSLGTPRRLAQWSAGAHDDARANGTGDTGTTDVADETTVLVRAGRSEEGGTAHRPVFLVHPSGGSVSFAHTLAAHLTAPNPVHGIRYPASLTGSLTTVPRMARHYVRLIRRVQPHGPYRVGGYSLGGYVALEIAQLLTGAGEQVEQVLMWDTQPPQPGTRARSEAEFLALFPELLRVTFHLGPAPDGEGDGRPPRTVEEAIASVRPPDWTDATVRELRTMYAIWRVCDSAQAAYEPGRYDGPVQLFTAQEPFPEGPLTELTGTGGGTCTVEGWRHLLTGELRATTVPGNHFSMFDEAAPRPPEGRDGRSPRPAVVTAYERALTTVPTTTTRNGPAPPSATAATAAHAPAPAPGSGQRPVALLFPGQGSQFEGMGRELFGRYPELTAEADQVLGYPIADVCAGDPRRPLKDTAYTQPAVYVVGALALRSHQEEHGEQPAVVLGHSVGEYNALEAAGVLSFAEGLRLVAERGAAMARIGGGGMIAVNGLTEDDIRAVLDGSGAVRPDSPGAPGTAAGNGRAHTNGHGHANGDGSGDRNGDGDGVPVDIAAANAPRLYTLAGPDADLEALTPVLLAGGARSVRRLDVSGPFHSRLMRPAAREFAAMLRERPPRWAPPAVPVLANTTARPHEPDTVQEELVAQIDHPVLWGRSVERAVADHDPVFHEIGGRRVLTPMISQIRGAMARG